MKQTKRRPIKTVIWAGAALISAFIVLAYVALPLFWTHFEHEPRLAALSMRTETAQHIAGDPLNVGFVGSKDEILSAFQQIGWSIADPLSLSNNLEIAESVILDQAYSNAPVSRLFYEGRQQDIAVEKAVGASPEQRHHARLWQVLEKGATGRPVWLGAVSFDTSVGLSHFTGQFTHHIDADIDAERNKLVKDVSEAGIVETVYQVSGIGPTLNGRNGANDRFYTDGEVTIMVLRPGVIEAKELPEMLENPPLIRLKQTIWSAFAGHRP